MPRLLLCLCLTLLLALGLSACGAPATLVASVTPAPALPTATPPPTATTAAPPTAPAVESGFEGGTLPAGRYDLFSASGACAVCHTQMTDEAGTDVSIDSAWRASMKAQSARDPYFLASVRAEVESLPDQRVAIEDSCATCHMPMADYTQSSEGGAGTILDDGFLDPQHPLHELAIDGVSCTLCHQIRPGNLGPTANSGRYLIDTQTKPGEREIFGPFTVDDLQAQIMQGASGFIPVQSTHMTQSELCATCHTLYSPVFDESGRNIGEFPEQVPYLEWFYSDYRQANACQGCHMPEAQGGVRVSVTSPNLRSPFTQHTFAGGNAYMLGMLQAFGQELELTASSAQLEAARQGTLAQLQTATATLAIEELVFGGSTLSANVRVENLVGHKFPTGFPSRRAWLHVTVTDATGAVVFESGDVEPDGSIIGNDNDADAGLYEPHYGTINKPDQVQIYEAILQTPEGMVTTNVLRAGAYLKDNRLLPSGFPKSAPYEDIKVRGGAFEDPDFDGGGDIVTYRVPVGSGSGPFTVTAELLFQTIGFRWAENLRQATGPEIDRFLAYYAAVPNIPIVISSTSLETP